MPKPTPPKKEDAGPPVAAPTSKLDTAKAIAEMCHTAGWQHVFVPAMQRRRDQILASMLNAEDTSKNFAGELAAIKILDAILNTKSKNEALLAMLRNF